SRGRVATSSPTRMTRTTTTTPTQTPTMTPTPTPTQTPTPTMKMKMKMMRTGICVRMAVASASSVKTGAARSAASLPLDKRPFPKQKTNPRPFDRKMRLQAKTRYGVRAVFDIAFHQTEGAVQAKDIARREEIPLRYLEQIFQDLKRAGIVESRRGPRGGYTLRRSPDDLRLGEVVRALQGSVEVDI